MICLPGPQFKPAEDISGNRGLHVLVASPLEVTRYRELCETAGENVTATKHGFESRSGQPLFVRNRAVVNDVQRSQGLIGHPFRLASAAGS